MKKTEKLTNNNYNTIKMNKVWKAIGIVGNLSEVIIASAMVADFISKIRWAKSTSPTTEAEVSPQPETPMAA